jgi:hypothetical protein
MDERYTFDPGGGRRYTIPGYMIDGLEDYINRHVPPGGFLRAVLENDLVEAVKRADNANMAALPAYARYLYNFAPRDAWGSPAKVKAWLGEYL